jgi:salmonella plasmid virulence protein D
MSITDKNILTSSLNETCPYYSNPTLSPISNLITGILVNHSEKYQSEIPYEITSRAKSEQKIFSGHSKRDIKATKNIQRTIKALKTKKNPEKINRENLTSKKLSEIAKDVNGSFIHCSGNCVLLSRAMLYNLTQGKNILSVNNTAPFYKGFDETIDIDKVIFGKALTAVKKQIDDVEDVVTAILDEFAKSKERLYLIESEGFEISIAGTSFTCGHDFNAVVLWNNNDKPYVQFVDAWKTSDFTPSEEKLAQRYSHGNFTIKKLA